MYTKIESLRQRLYELTLTHSYNSRVVVAASQELDQLMNREFFTPPASLQADYKKKD
ncbi:MAG: aspartyl-phosphate phosphatase Spo0E family protein [Bacilli bacterium]